jgi:predicted N-acetyltransferase YhbS
MTKPIPIIRLQTSEDQAAITRLNELAFGPGRFTRTAYRVREGAATEPRLNLCVVAEEELIGAVQFTPIEIGSLDHALLLGPLVISDAYKNQGWGLKLMLEGMSRARSLGYKLVILVGDLPYYARAGFATTPPGQIDMPGPVDPSRLLYAELVPGAAACYKGLVRGLPELYLPSRYQVSERRPRAMPRTAKPAMSGV